MNDSRATIPESAPLLTRAPLLERAAGAVTRLVVLEAPAGYGKSTLARQIAGDAGGTGIVDALGLRDAVHYHRRLLDGMIAAGGVGTEEDWKHRTIGLVDVDGWRQLCLRCWREAAAPGYVVFENSEALAEYPEALATLAAIFERSQPERRAIICSRKSLPFRYGRFAFPHEVVRFSAEELRFSARELAELFGLDPETDAVRRIEHLTQGWPIAALFVRRLRYEGRFVEEELAANSGELFGYLADEILATLSAPAWDALFVVSALDDTTREDIAAALGHSATASTERLLAEAPFVVAYGETLQLHPLLRALVRSRHAESVNRAGRCIAQGHAAAGQTLRSAQVYLALGDAPAAADVLDGMERPAWIATPSYELTEVMSRLDRDGLVAHPALWAATATARAKTISPQAWLHEGIEIWSLHERTMSDAVAVDVAAAVINACMNLGMLQQCEHWLAVMRERQPSSLVVSIWTTEMDAILGRPVDISTFERDVLTRLDGHPKALLLHDIVARVHRQRGERDLERETSALALDISLKTKIPLGIALTAMDAAFGAWLAGEDGLYAEYVSVAESHLTPTSGAQFFLECAHGYGSAARPGYEKLKTRADALLIAAAQALGEERKALLARSLEAAEASRQPYPRILTRCAAAFSDAKQSAHLLFEAGELAAHFESRALREAVENLQHGGEGGILAPLIRRFRSRSQRASFDVILGVAAIDGKPIVMPDRQTELLTLLAVRRRNVHREELAETMWPDTERETALGALRTTISRLRAVPGLKDVVVTSTAGYALSSHVSLDLEAMRQTLSTAEASVRSSLTESARAQLQAQFDLLIERDRSRGARWEWFASTERDLEVLTQRAGNVLMRTAFEAGDLRESLAIARRLAAYDPLDETAREHIIRAFVALGDIASARREIADFESVCRRELGATEPATALRALLVDA